MARHYKDWLSAFVEYASYGEAPRHMYFWTAVSTIAGALQRKCWIDQAYFKWYPNFYIVLVAPPGIVSKSTTAGIGMELLRKVEGVKFGPEIVTWQSLAKSFGNAAETFEYNGMFHTMSALTIESSEFGNLLDPQDKQMVDILVTLWDGKDIRKETKGSGSDEIINPWINLIACTTPSWIAGNFPEYMIGGGLTSRMVFVYADKKERYVAYPANHVPANMAETGRKLVEDLQHISANCIGEYKLTEEATAWGEKWYRKHYSSKPKNLDDDRFGGYLARKQTHIHKLAIIVAASESDQMWITKDHLELAGVMVTDLEPDMAQVFSKIGKTDESFYADRLVAYCRRCGTMPYSDVYRYIYSQFPSLRDFEDVLAGAVRAGFLRLTNIKGVPTIEPVSREALHLETPRQ